MKYWEIVARNLTLGWSWGYCSAFAGAGVGSLTPIAKVAATLLSPTSSSAFLELEALLW
jgi:hypothetical protein